MVASVCGGKNSVAAPLYEALVLGCNLQRVSLELGCPRAAISCCSIMLLSAFVAAYNHALAGLCVLQGATSSLTPQLRWITVIARAQVQLSAASIGNALVSSPFLQLLPLSFLAAPTFAAVGLTLSRSSA